MNARAGLALLALCVVAGCAAPPPPASTAAAARTAPSGTSLPASALVQGVRFYPQADQQGGPSVLAMAVTFSGIQAAPDDLAPVLSAQGRPTSLQAEMQKAAHRIGLFAVPVTELGAILRELAAGNPVVVFQNAGHEPAPSFRFALAVGYDLDTREIVLHSGAEAGLRIGLDRFERYWARAGRWAMLVLPPGKLPVSAPEPALNNAAIALERAGRSQAATLSFSAILLRYPDNLVSMVGLGNARFAAGDAIGAEAAYRQAVRRHPNAAVAWNNLAFVRAEMGDLNEALEMATRAVSLGGPNADTFAETLEAIRARLAKS